MTLVKLFELLNAGVFKVSVYDSGDVAEIGGQAVSLADANKLAHSVGWVEAKLDAFTLMNKTGKFLRAMQKYATNDRFNLNTEVEFHNIQSSEYGKTFDRIVMSNMETGDRYTIIYNMPSQGSKYAIYVNGSAIPATKCRTMKSVAEYFA